MPEISQTCTYTPPSCNSWIYSDWSDCQTNSTQTRTITNSSPEGCTGGNPVLTQSCDYAISIPTITSISPNIIYPKTEVVLYGSGFGSYEANCYILDLYAQLATN